MLIDPSINSFNWIEVEIHPIDLKLLIRQNDMNVGSTDMGYSRHIITED